MKATTITAAAVTLMLMGGLTACTHDAAAPSSTVPAATDTTASTSPAPTATETTPAPPTAGASITTDAEAAAAKAAGLGVFDIYDADGNYTNSIVFDKAAPLPDPIKAAIAAPVKAALDAAMATGITGDTGTAEQVAAVSSIAATARTKVQSASDKAGRNIVLVYPSYGSMDGTHYGTVWGATSATGDIRKSGSMTPEGSIAAAQAWIAAQPAPETYEIVVAG